MAESAEYIHDIIRYFENQAKSAESQYQFEEQKINNNRSFALGLLNIFLVLSLTIMTLSSSSYFSTLARNTAGLGIIQNGISGIDKTLPFDTQLTRFNGWMNVTDTILISDSNAESTYTKGVRFAIGIMILSMVMFVYMTGAARSTTKMNDEIISTRAIISSLYRIKVEWSHKLTEQDVKKSLIKFYISTKDYEQMLLGLIDKFEGEEQSAQGTVKDALAIKPA